MHQQYPMLSVQFVNLCATNVGCDRAPNLDCRMPEYRWSLHPSKDMQSVSLSRGNLFGDFYGNFLYYKAVETLFPTVRTPTILLRLIFWIVKYQTENIWSWWVEEKQCKKLEEFISFSIILSRFYTLHNRWLSNRVSWIDGENYALTKI